MKKNVLGVLLLSSLCIPTTLANSSYVNLHAEEATSVVEDDFLVVSPDNCKAIEKVGVGGDGANGNPHGLVPGPWGGSVAIADESYLVYQIDADEGNVLSSLKLDINAKIWNQNDGTAHNENAIKVFISEDNANFNEVTRIGVQGGEFVDLDQIDLTTYVTNKKSIYVKVQLIQTKATGESVDLWMLGVKVAKIKFTSTQTISTPIEDINDITIEDDFTTERNFDAYLKVGVSSDANIHGLVPGPWGANVTIADESYLVYQLLANENKVFESLKLDINAKIWNQNDGTAHDENKIKVFVSTDATNYELVKAYNADGTFDMYDLEQLDLSSYANESTKLFVKIQMVQSKATGTEQELNMLGVKIKSIKFTIKEKEYQGPVIEYTHVKDVFTSVGDTIDAYKVVNANGDYNEHGLVPGTWGSNVEIADESYLMYKLVADDGLFTSLSLAINAKIWNQNDGTAHNENSIKVYAGLTENSLSEVQSLGVSSGHNMSNEFVDFQSITLDSIANGEHTVYVKVALNQSKSLGNVQDLFMVGVKLGSVDFSYTQEAAEMVNITYKGLDGTILATDEKQVKGKMLNGFEAPSVDEYTFDGWYLDETFTTALTTNFRPMENTTIYAKYTILKYEIMYMLDGGINSLNNPLEYTSKDNITLEDPTKEGYVFKGWYTEPTFEEISKIDTIDGTLKADIVLFAKWEKVIDPTPDKPSDDSSEIPSVTPSESPSETSSETISEMPSENSSSASSDNNSSDKPTKKGCKGMASTTGFSLIALLGTLLLKKRKY